MSIWVALRGIIRDQPEAIETTEAEAVTAFVMLDAHQGQYHGETFPLDRVPVCEVVVRGRAAVAVLNELKAGDSVVALGVMNVTLPIASDNDAELVSVIVEVYAVGRDLAA